MVNSDSTFTEIGSPWFDNAVAMEGLLNPHGIATDLNGNVYIGEHVTKDNDVRKFTCDGQIVPESEWVLPTNGQTNMGSIGNSLYSNQRFTGPHNLINEFDLCTGQLTGQAQFCENFIDWGFYIDPRTEIMYATTTFTTNVNHSSDVYIFTQSDFDLDDTTCISPSALDLEAVTGTTKHIAGITTDINGNVYVVVHTGGAQVLKFGPAPTYTYIGSSLEDTTGADNSGWNQAIGIVYSETTDLLYVSTTSATDDCVSTFNTNLDYLGVTVPSTGSESNSKGIALTRECCPTNNNVTIDTTLCAATINQVLYLQELINCDGIICEGLWEEEMSTGLSYEPCDNSVTIDALNACGTFSLESDGTGNNPQCGAFKITVNISVAENSTVTITGDQSHTCPLGAFSELSATTTADSIQWQISTTSCTDGFTDLAGEINSTYTPSGLTDTTFFRVKAINKDACATGNCEVISDCVTVNVEEDCVIPCPDVTCGAITINGNTTTPMSMLMDSTMFITDGVFGDYPAGLIEKLTGRYQIAQGGVTFYEDIATNDFDINIPTCIDGNTPKIKAAYLSWMARCYGCGVDAIFDEELTLEINNNGSPQTVMIDKEFLASGTFTGANQSSLFTGEYHHGLADITTILSNNTIAGTNNFNISDFSLPTQSSGASHSTADKYGVGLIIVYECEEYDLRDIVISAGQDFFYCSIGEDPTDPSTFSLPGPFATEICVSFPSSTSPRTIDLNGLVGGQANSATPFRGNQFKYLTGTGAIPSNNGAQPPAGIIVNDPNALDIAAPNSIMTSNLGTEWDSINQTITIPAGDTWLCIQAWSIESGGSDQCVSGNILTPVFSMPSSCQDTIYRLCESTNEEVIIQADASYTNVIWYNDDGTQVGTGTSLTVTDATSGMADNRSSFYYTAEDATGCFIELCCPVEIEACSCPEITAAVADVLKCTQNSETIIVEPSGGAEPYTYSWSGPYDLSGETEDRVTTSIPGIYTVTVTDDNDCTVTTSGELTFQSKVCLPVTFKIRRGNRSN